MLYEVITNKAKYAYNFFWLGVPIIQEPQDLQALQEIIWEVKPDLIIETGIAWGGSLVFSASMLAILETCGVIEDVITSYSIHYTKLYDFLILIICSL